MTSAQLIEHPSKRWQKVLFNNRLGKDPFYHHSMLSIEVVVVEGREGEEEEVSEFAYS